MAAPGQTLVGTMHASDQTFWHDTYQRAPRWWQGTIGGQSAWFVGDIIGDVGV